ncbi:hypothetical protein BJ138DRAFT_1182736 [Hygrophoropsis aurantiaca]|uniref:Uncharacterized protein n=1 Tax=Hygrophoropsis aurantiaca TaxID=72124 RepID=A0ACB8A201_9AGAM|nr:hypothetical protein BJ138DRAFT_1182736 [Hygrophoropsis aurantiaca]
MSAGDPAAALPIGQRSSVTAQDNAKSLRLRGLWGMFPLEVEDCHSCLRLPRPAAKLLMGLQYSPAVKVPFPEADARLYIPRQKKKPEPVDDDEASEESFRDDGCLNAICFCEYLKWLKYRRELQRKERRRREQQERQWQEQEAQAAQDQDSHEVLLIDEGGNAALGFEVISEYDVDYSKLLSLHCTVTGNHVQSGVIRMFGIVDDAFGKLTIVDDKRLERGWDDRPIGV